MILRFRRKTNMSNLSLFDGLFNGMPRSELYRAQVFPEVFPHEKRMLVENWSVDDQQMYVGGKYTVGYKEVA